MAEFVSGVHSISNLVSRKWYYKNMTQGREFVLMAPVLMVLAGHGYFARAGLDKTPQKMQDFLATCKAALASSYALRKTAPSAATAPSTKSKVISLF